jgi:hypothetical protein
MKQQERGNVTIFYIARGRDGAANWIAAHDLDGGDRLFAWLANDERWHHNIALEEAFYSLTPETTFEPISADEAAQKILTWPQLDRKLVGWVVDELMAAPTITPL